MIATTVLDRRELEGMLHHAAGRLSPTHVATLVAHPDAVQSALAAAADALSADDRDRLPSTEIIKGDSSLLISTEEARGRLATHTRMGASESLLTSDEVATRAGLKTRQSVHNWRKKGRIIGWQNARRGYVFPATQFDNRNRPLSGLDCVVEQFGDSYTAWMWLTTPQPSLGGATPLAVLGRGEIDRVTDAARGGLQGDFV